MTLLAITEVVEPTWLLLVKPLFIIAVVLSITAVLQLVERKLLGRLQSRYGPNRTGPYGLMQPLADPIKLMGKEISSPVTSQSFLMAAAPVISIFAAMVTLAIIPFGNVGAWGDFGLYGIDVPIGILFAFAFGSLGSYGLLVGGWSSGSKYSFLGAMRSAAQLVSYEISMALALIGVVMMAETLSLTEIVEAQNHIWYIVPQFVGFLVFMVAGLAEINRVPFDLPEADAELVGGYNTEYGGMRFGSFAMAEYMNMIIFSAIVTVMFLGGWRGPGPDALGPLWTLVKIMALIIFFMWIRGTLPRLRYDQLMSFGWKVLLPIATLNALVTAVLVVVL